MSSVLERKPVTDEEATRLTLGFTPRWFQEEAWSKLRRFAVLVWHRRAGKTVFAIIRLVAGAVGCKLPLPRFYYIAPELKQAKETAWAYLKAFTAVIPGRQVHEAELSITFPHNGAKIRIYGADNPDAIRGIYLDGVVLDEVAQMKPQVWGEIVRPMLMDRQGWALFIGSAKGINLFSELYFKALQFMADPTSDWYADMRRASETHALSDEEMVKARAEIADEATWNQEMECDFQAAVANALIKLPDVLEAMKRHVRLEEFNFAPRVIGVDVARYGDDASAIAPRQGLCAFQIREMRGLDTMALAAQVAQVCDKWKPAAAFIEINGIGSGVYDRVVQLGYPMAIPVDMGSKPDDPRFTNKRTECWAKAADWVKQGSLPNDHGLMADLCAPLYSYANAANKQALESKDDIKERLGKSPDKGDAFCLSFAYPVAHRDPLMPPMGKTVNSLGYDRAA